MGLTHFNRTIRPILSPRCRSITRMWEVSGTTFPSGECSPTRTRRNLRRTGYTSSTTPVQTWCLPGSSLRARWTEIHPTRPTTCRTNTTASLSRRQSTISPQHHPTIFPSTYNWMWSAISLMAISPTEVIGCRQCLRPRPSSMDKRTSTWTR